MMLSGPRRVVKLALTGLLEVVGAPPDAVVPVAVVVTSVLVAVEGEGGQPVQLNTRWAGTGESRER